MLSKTVYVVNGAIGNQAKTAVIDVEDVVAADALRTALAALSDGHWSKMSFASRAGYTGSAVAGSNSDYRGIAYFQDSSTGQTLHVTIPAIKSSAVEAVPGRDGGERITAAAMTTIETALETATGRALTSLYGVVVQKR